VYTLPRKGKNKNRKGPQAVGKQKQVTPRKILLALEQLEPDLTEDALRDWIRKTGEAMKEAS